MPKFIETPLVDAVQSLDVTTDEKTVLLTCHLENDTTFRFPISVETAMRM